MKCPICGKGVPVWSPAINRFGGDKSCPHCGAKVRFTINLGIAVTAVLIAVVLAFVFSVSTDFGARGRTALAVLAVVGAILFGGRLSPRA
jgi:hypothetical protein